MENIFKQPTDIATRDIDVAIRMDSWKNFDKFIEYLKSDHNFKDGKNPHEFISPEGILTDILPYGEIEDNRTLSFPNDFKQRNQHVRFSGNL